MILKPHAIPTLLAIAGICLLLLGGGLNVAADHHTATGPHGHAHTHFGPAHAHGVHAGGDQDLAEGYAFVQDAGGCDHPVFAAALLLSPHHGCCHEDHSHPSPVFALTVTGSRWDDHLPSLSCPLPDLWQPTVMASPVIQPMPPPPRGCPGDPISQLRTVVMLT